MCGGEIYSLSLKSLSCRVSLSTMDCLFDFNKARMNEKSHHLTDVSATQGDKQGRAEGRKEGRGEERRGEERRGERRRGGPGRWRRFFSCFLAVGGLSDPHNYAKQSVGKRGFSHHPLLLCLPASAFSAFFCNNAKQDFNINRGLFWFQFFYFMLPKKSATAAYYIHEITWFIVSQLLFLSKYKNRKEQVR